MSGRVNFKARFFTHGVPRKKLSRTLFFYMLLRSSSASASSISIHVGLPILIGMRDRFAYRTASCPVSI